MHLFWQAVDSLCEPETSWAHWKSMLGEELPAFHRCLLLTDRVASHVPKPGCRYTWLHVTESVDGGFVGIDEDNDERFPLEKRDVLSYRVDESRLVRVIGDTINLAVKPTAVAGTQSVHRIAIDRPRAGLEFPVFLSINWDDRDVMPLLCCTDRPFVLIRPTATRLDTASATMLDQRGVTQIFLSECTRLDNAGRFTFTPAGVEQLEAFRSRHLPMTKPTEPSVTFPTPAEATWKDVAIRLIDGETARISVGGCSATHHYAQLGMANSRNAKPTKQWELLRALAANRGLLTWRDAGASASVKKQVQSLCKKLAVFLAIDGTPIEFDRTAGGYRTLFAVESEE